MKEELLKYVDEIVCRQNRESPSNQVESFLIENSARKVLKELLYEFQSSQDELKQKLQSQEEYARATRMKTDNQDQIIKGIHQSVSVVNDFERRVTKLENKS